MADYVNSAKDLRKAPLDPDLPMNALRNSGELLFGSLCSLPSTGRATALAYAAVFGATWRAQLWTKGSWGRIVSAVPFTYLAVELKTYASNIVESRNDRSIAHRASAGLLGTFVLMLSAPFQAEAFSRIVARTPVSQGAFSAMMTMVRDLISLFTSGNKAFLQHYSGNVKKALPILVGADLLNMVQYALLDFNMNAVLFTAVNVTAFMASDVLRFAAIRVLFKCEPRLTLRKIAVLVVGLWAFTMSVGQLFAWSLGFLNGFSCLNIGHNSRQTYVAVGNGAPATCTQCDAKGVPTHGTLRCSACRNDSPKVVSCADCRKNYWRRDFFTPTSSRNCGNCEAAMLTTREGKECSVCSRTVSARWIRCPICALCVCEPCCKSIDGL